MIERKKGSDDSGRKWEAQGKKDYLIAKGRLANLAAAEGHQPEVMQMSSANQFLAAIRLHTDHKSMDKKIFGVSLEIDDEVSRAALRSMGSP